MYMIFLQSSGNFLESNWPLLLAFVVFMFITIYPQSRKQKQTKEYQEGIKRGDMIVTNGGIVGKVLQIDEQYVTIQLEGKSAMKLLRSAINMENSKTLNK